MAGASTGPHVSPVHARIAIDGSPTWRTRSSNIVFDVASASVSPAPLDEDAVLLEIPMSVSRCVGSVFGESHQGPGGDGLGIEAQIREAFIGPIGSMLAARRSRPARAT